MEKHGKEIKQRTLGKGRRKYKELCYVGIFVWVMSLLHIFLNEIVNWFMFLSQVENVTREEKTVGCYGLFGIYSILLLYRGASYISTAIFSPLIVVKVICFRFCNSCYLIYDEIDIITVIPVKFYM